MDAIPGAVEDGETLPQDEPEAVDEAAFAELLCAHNLMSVLLPATPPPVPGNARIIRLFDLEAAKYDPKPGEAGTAAPARKEQQRSRAALREQRSQSLFAAARYF